MLGFQPLSSTAVGVDLQNNILVYTGNSASEKVTMWCVTFYPEAPHLNYPFGLIKPFPCSTKDYVAAAYVDIFTTRPISTIQNRTITLSELAPTGMEIAAIMKEKNGRDPSIATRSLEEVNRKIEDCISRESNLAVAAYCRKIWGTGEMMKMLPNDLWEVKDYRKASLEDLVLGGRLESYRVLPDQVLEFLKTL
ncbi:unnamed protein product [Aspergillus oryzae var. brunneus]|uniref:Unnamed protein product n=1 Tax=Aspergillus oryzae var. brunneus TaxID=332754 RepID=A0ABQ6KUS0_ASPOZ|nr:unnamed protein product [Aspergillus oryzae]GMG47890.1 unnamed protein product [Aspergillus oryzae var. brunneus]